MDSNAARHIAAKPIFEGDDVDGPSDMAYWAAKAAGYLEPLLAAAMLIGQDAGTVVRWIAQDAAEAEDILRAHGLTGEADRLAELRIESRHTADSIKAVMTATLARQDPRS
jgi:hypothetical protein